jgi:hypothetical protein
VRLGFYSANPEVSALANHEQLAFEGGGVRTVLAAADEELPNHRFLRLDAESEAGIVARHVAPAEHLLPFLVRDQLEREFAFLLGRFVLRHEYHGDRVFSGRR